MASELNSTALKTALTHVFILFPFVRQTYLVIYWTLNLNSTTLIYIDRTGPLRTVVKKSKGGVLVAVNRIYPSWKLQSSFTNLECIFVCIKIASSLILLCSAYLPPASLASTYNDFGLAVEEIVTNGPRFDKIINTGDFNQPSVNWTDCLSSALNTSSQHLVDLACFFNLKQHNTVLNKRGVILDLIFSSDLHTIVEPAVDILIDLEDDHPALIWDMVLNSSPPPSRVTFILDLKRCDLIAVFNWLSNQSYPVVTSNNVEHCFSTFCADLSSIGRANCPLKKIGASVFPSWYSSELKDFIIRKKTVHKLYKSTLKYEHLLNFKQLRYHCRLLVSHCRQRFMNRINQSVISNSKLLWGFVNQLRNVLSFPTKITFEGRTAEDSDYISNLFADYFSTIFKEPASEPPTYNYTKSKNISIWQSCCDRREETKKSQP
ncbi:uncharacterized protein LOC124368171 [Homalodisca vitripennis]|uniref:uncharacterized protein LOC124368171 n=1 Tax=Homalodisca vitripennis TaxID=197043 RepID=UPI001EEC3241|nr:uncharacterized protein LOC124368171 [Homalodisca vitripennis]